MDDDPELSALRAAMDAKGYRNVDLGRLLGLDSPQITRIFKGRRRIQRHEWRKIEGWLGGQTLAPPAGEPVAFLPGTVPLYGWTGHDDRLALGPDDLLGAVPMHPAQANVRDAFAVQVADETMAPRYDPGETIYLAPRRWPKPGKDCLVQLRDGRAFVARLLRRHEGQVELTRFGGPPLLLPVDELEAIHAVVGRD